MNLTVFQKGLVLIALPLLLQLVFVLAAVRLQRDHEDAERWAAHTKNVIARTHEIHGTVADAHASVRGYVISGDQSFAQPFRDALRNLPQQFDELDEFVRDSAEQAERARVLRDRGNGLFVWQRDIENLLQGGATEEAVKRVQTGRGNVLMAEFRQGVKAFLDEEERLDRERGVALERSRTRLNRLFIFGGLAVVASTFALGFVFHRSIARRFAELEANAHRLAAGKVPTAPLEGNDEIASADRAFREMAAELTRASEQARDLYDNAPCGYHSVDQDGVLVAVNRTELEWLGYEADEVIGRRRFVDLVDPNSRAAYQRGFDRVREEGAVVGVELDLARKDGTTFPVLVSSSSVRGSDGRYLRSRTMLTDLTERKRAEDEVRRLNTELEERVRTRTAELGRTNAALREEEALFRGAFDTTNMAMVLTDLDNRFIRANAAFARMFGYAKSDEVLGLGLADVTHPNHLDESLDRRAVLLAGTSDHFQMEKQYRHKDGHVLWGLTNVALVRGPDGRPLMYVGQVQDITERKAAELAVRERSAALAEANRDLAQKNTENEMFVYSVSHDLRSPLVNLQGFSKELEKGCQQLTALVNEESVPPDVRTRGRALLEGKMAKSIGFIQTAVLRLSGIIDALLRLSRVGRIEYRWDVVDVSRIVAQVVGAAQGTIAERGATVRVGDLPTARGDRTALEQLFGNLIGNALTYLDPARPGVIEIGCLPLGTADVPSGFRTYFVRDNGLGIAPVHRQKIFQAFQRAHPGVGSGEGLGLAIVARVAERHHGRVWVESHPGAGSTFFVTLPVPGDASTR
ncbi:histidine kinase : Histidine kinase OS=Burkholderia sp. H160 GN=BH160DRAFT_5724 PE=4 SV=1: CHASE3: HAMP: PAS_9: PAS_9: HisKA: HATPase_c [Gemmata massiliana]|uniref:histidine kinase n=1 Tax=Gemmata massiliana TaxID=1210884 RepID=A0A6P2CZ89_9BACT|nr:PAS domain S-box protein [Gemmata massiliana]VTR93686.1 histidine kinase : Histidine kinase OS=Burkholderia sp. H160 GN=BH160DRAFT_5724 PE=4 SV=1: CHASE3: HAMP: PAS_9: PAS_9: HisKA: HATPase_c [Gemmata massiliana]